MLIGLSIEHLSAQLRNFGFGKPDTLPFESLSFLLVSGECGAIDFEPSLVGAELLFNFRDVLRKCRNFFKKSGDSKVELPEDVRLIQRQEALVPPL